jgi:SNF2 family DNA or RNA helicase
MLKQLWAGRIYKSHQVTGIKWMLNQESASIAGGLLCDDMGLGKTTEVLGLIANSTLPNSSSLHTLLLCPKAVISQWVADAKKCEFNVLEAEGNIWKKPTPFFSKRPFLYITNYEKLARRRSLFQRPWGRICLDEAHRINNINGRLFTNIKKIDRSITWCITATPIINSIKDLRVLFTLIGHDPLKLLDIPYTNSLVKSSLLHRSMEEMRPYLKELPSAAIIHKTILPFDCKKEEDFYRGVQGKIVDQWKALDTDNATGHFELIIKLRQLSIHPQVYISAKKKASPAYIRDNWEGTSTKFSHLNKLIQAETTPKRWIIFCQFRDEMELLEDFLYDCNTVGRIQSYHGGVPTETKDKIIEATKQSIQAHEILLLQLQSGGVGLNLQHFNNIVFMSPWWTKALMNQAIGRAVRIGQTGAVNVFQLLLDVEDSLNIDTFMLEKAEAKGDLLADVLKQASRGEIYSEKQTIS